jgi:hypothetical protein
VQRKVAKAQVRVLQPFTQDEKMDDDESILTCMSEKIYLQTLVEEHNQRGKHLVSNLSVLVLNTGTAYLTAIDRHHCYCFTSVVA